ncbi:lysine-specific demethylase JMJ21 isoform X3 [Physcomitrium patens]|uniref:lysine-specific demethylase JMJ21 isoform X3 n=1 Tax=Physcomitrium patens TaxID=3218 RepID=UPI000D162BA1|nr:F-box protein At1g78280-like isoform X3 [Physcomitrium patens]|eukprot:XP_024388879.1 F-box protein At1g78280-like isoform X3 [Physcomitrella patens]
MGQPRDRRPDALGDFCVLPDETLCSIIASLPPRTVGVLACVSSVFYIFCDEEPLWMDLCLDLYHGGYLDFEGSWRQSALIKLGYVEKGTRLVKPPMRFDGFSSMFLYKRWYRCNMALESFACDTGVIDRKKNLSLEEFRSKYDGKKPVLITDLTKDWPAQKTWNWPQLVDKYGDVGFKVSQAHGSRIKMKLKDYATYMACQHDEEPLYIFDAEFGESAPDMLEEYSIPPVFSEDLLAVLDKSVRPPFRWLVAGPARSGASWHVDPALTSAWNTLLSGRKRWALYPPGRVPPAVVVHVDLDDGSVNFDGPTSLQWWLEVYPTLRDEDKPLECTQLPGETISVPSGWWHCVLNIDDSVAVTQNYVNSSNLELVCLDMAPGFYHRGIARAGHLAIQGRQDKPAERIKSNEEFCANSVAFVEGNLCNANASELLGEKLGRDLNDPDGYVSYFDVDYLATHTEKESNHYISSTSKDGYLDRSELRHWLRQLWKLRPDLHVRLWKCACLAVDAESWLHRVIAICKTHNFSIPVDEEQLPIGNGSNPVYFVGDFVIKLCVEEGGPWVATDGLRTELQFYSLLNETGSPLKDTIPSLVASGIVLPDGKDYKVEPWNGYEDCSRVVEAHSVGMKRSRNISKLDKSRYRTNCSEAELAKVSIDDNAKDAEYNENQITGLNDETVFWPYIVHKRRDGTNMDRVMDMMTEGDYAAAAVFLGEQVRLLHSLPLPSTLSRTTWAQKISRLNGQGSTNSIETSVTLGHGIMVNGSVVKHCFDSSVSTDKANTVVGSEMFLQTGISTGDMDKKKELHADIPMEWHYFVGLMRQQRAKILERFEIWESLPPKLLEQLETYLPEDPAVLVGLQKVQCGSPRRVRPPVWLHMDIMADNIQMIPYSEDKQIPGLFDLSQLACVNKEIRNCRAMQPRYILDFGDVTLGKCAT